MQLHSSESMVVSRRGGPSSQPAQADGAAVGPPFRQRTKDENTRPNFLSLQRRVLMGDRAIGRQARQAGIFARRKPARQLLRPARSYHIKCPTL